MDKYNEDLLNVIFSIKKIPGIYLGTKSVSRLRSFLDGFSLGYNYPSMKPNFRDFQERMEAKYRVRESIGWDMILLRQTNDETQAFDLFFEEFEECLKECGIDIPERSDQ